MRIRFDVHRAAICTAANKKLRIPLTKNEQLRGARRALLGRTRRNSSRAPFQRMKTCALTRVSSRNKKAAWHKAFHAFVIDAQPREAREPSSAFAPEPTLAPGHGDDSHRGKFFFTAAAGSRSEERNRDRTHPNRPEVIRAQRLPCGVPRAPSCAPNCDRGAR
jgi:hypothetical protein